MTSSSGPGANTDKPDQEDQVRALYEAYPYPPRRDQGKEADLALGCLDSLPRINHALWGGTAPFEDGFRILIAGGGAGDATVRLARQFAYLGTQAEIVHLDLSQHSMDIAKARLGRYGLEETVTFHQGSLLEIADFGFGPFDYINCSGVLHHLEDPDAGLRALSAQLTEDGGIGVMLYGELGRTGIYDVQDIMRTLSRGLPDPARVQMARRLLKALPDTHRLKRNAQSYGDPDEIADADVMDLFLHPQDRAYRVPDLFALLEQADLTLSGLSPAWVYQPDWLVSDPIMVSTLRLLPKAQAMATAELLSGALPTHTFFAKRTAAPPVDADAAPYLIPTHLSLADAFTEGGTTLSFGALEKTVALPDPALRLLPLINGQRTEIDLRDHWPGTEAEFGEALASLWALLGPADMLWRSALPASFDGPTAPPMLMRSQEKR